MKSKTPFDHSFINSSQDGERDVLMDTQRKEPRVRASIIGDKKLTTRDAFERRGTTGIETVSREATQETFSQKIVAREPVARNPVARESIGRETQGRTNNVQHSASTKPNVETPPWIEKHSRAVFDDPIAPRADTKFRRERGYNKVSPQRNSNAAQEVRAKVPRTLIYVGLMFLLCLFVGVAYFASGPVTKLLERPLKSVAVEGQFQYLPKNRAMELITAEIDGDFLQLNLDHLKNVLEADPWVEHVSLSRRWPDTLLVKIAEQQPIARWDTNGFLNQRGEIIRVKEADKLLGLPWLQGNEINAREIMQQYQDLSTLLRARGLEIITLKCDNKKSWRITLKNDVDIAIGRDQVMEKMRRFVTVYDNFLSGVWSDVKSIDVRYTNGVAVRWAPDSAMAKKYVKPDSSVKPGAIKVSAVKLNVVKN